MLTYDKHMLNKPLDKHLKPLNPLAKAQPIQVDGVRQRVRFAAQRQEGIDDLRVIKVNHCQ